MRQVNFKGPSPIAWRMLLASAAATAVAGAAQGFRLAPLPLVSSLLIGVMMLGLTYLYSYHRPREWLAVATGCAGFFVCYSIVMGPMCYVVASLNMPLQDALLSRFDVAIGFDWLAVHKATLEKRWLADLSAWIYAHSAHQMLVAWIVLAATQQLDRLTSLFGAVTLATIVTLAVSAFLPAVGAYTFHGISDEALANMRGTGAGAWHVKDFLAVRSGALRYLDPKSMEGITQFPSFHTVVAATAGWATWRTRYAKWPMAIFSAAVIWTTLPIGGHYVIDILAGLAVTALGLRWMAQPDAGRDRTTANQGLKTA